MFKIIKGFLLIIFVTTSISRCSCQDRSIINIKAFAKLYGYVRWFHPSDEAQQINWEKFAIYGVSVVENAPNEKALRDSLLKLFSPIAPSLRINIGKKNKEFDISQITPTDTTRCKIIAWQHSGIELNSTFYSGYKSIRLNRPVSNKSKLPNLFYYGKALKFHNSKVKLTFKIKGKKEDQVNVFIQGVNKRDLQKNRYGININRVECKNNWITYEVVSNITNEEFLAFGITYIGIDSVYVDDFKLEVYQNGKWNDTRLLNGGLENITEKMIPEGFYSFDNVEYETKSVSNKISKKGNYCVVISKKNNLHLFRRFPKVGEYLNGSISDDLCINLPLALLGNDSTTYPVGEHCLLEQLKIKIQNSSKDSIYERIGALVICRNIFQHFYPYFSEAGVDWEKEFEMAIKNTYNIKTKLEFLGTLKKMTAKLKDGHIRINYPTYDWACLPVWWEWSDNKLVITKVLSNENRIKVGDIVDSIKSISSKEYFKEIQQYISTATPGYLDYLSQRQALMGKLYSDCSLSVTENSGSKKKVKLNHSLWITFYQKITNQKKYQFLENNFIYLNLDRISMHEIDSLMPNILNSKGLICDLRGYPADNINPFLSNLLNEPDTVKWMSIPQIIYPDNKKMEFNEWKGWGLKPKEPYINIPVVFITDGRAISYAESVMGLVKHYKLGTIVGQPTAGTNGNVNSFTLPGNFKISFTGMKVTKLDGSQHHGIGVLPDVYVEKTIKGVIEGRDEFLEKALEVLKEKK